MATYVISDIHGCLAELDALLEKIQFSAYDDLYIIGDVVDRGPKGIAVLQKIMQHPNMHMIMGNHDQWFLDHIQELIDFQKDNGTFHLNDSLLTWLHHNGGYITADEFYELSLPECYDIKVFLENLEYYQQITVEKNRFLLVHAGLCDEYLRPDVRISQVPKELLLLSCVELGDNPFPDQIMIVGHTPTFQYGEQYEGKIIFHNQMYHIDCGCCFGYRLGCLRLDDFQEFYVDSLQERKIKGCRI